MENFRNTRMRKRILILRWSPPLYILFFFQNFRFKHNLFTSLIKIILFKLCWFGMQVGVSMLCTSLVGKMRRWLSSFEEIYNISLQRLSFWGFRQQICRGKCVKGDKPWIWADHLIIVSCSKKKLIIVIVYIVEKNWILGKKIMFTPCVCFNISVVKFFWTWIKKIQTLYNLSYLYRCIIK